MVGKIDVQLAVFAVWGVDEIMLDNHSDDLLRSGFYFYKARL